MIKLKKTININTPVSIISPWNLMSGIKYVPKFYELDGTEFCFISELNTFVFEEDSIVMFEKNSTVSLLDKILSETEILPWELKRISPEPNKDYILNQYMREDSSIYKIKKSKEQDLVGTWTSFSNNEEIIFSMITNDRDVFDEEFTRLLICFPEKTEIPYNPMKIKLKTNFILYNLWKNQLFDE